MAFLDLEVHFIADTCLLTANQQQAYSSAYAPLHISFIFALLSTLINGTDSRV
jgi:hypothetical protein